MSNLCPTHIDVRRRRRIWRFPNDNRTYWTCL